MVRRPLAVALLLGLFFGLLPRPVGADFKDDYRQGLAAFEGQDWPALEASMKAAIAQRREADRRIRLGGRSGPYVPYFYLGVSRFQQGDCAGALKAWEESRRQGVVQDVQQIWPQLQRFVTQCEQAMSRAQRLQQALTEARELLEQAGGLYNALQAQRHDPANQQVWSAHPTLLETLGALNQKYQSALQALGRGQRNRELMPLNNVRQRVPGLLEEMRELQAQIDEARATLPTSPAPTQATPPPPPPPRPSLEPPPASPADGPPLEIRDAALAYLDGDYARVLRLLGTDPPSEEKARVAAHLLLAAARHALYLEGGEQDEALLDSARRDVEAGKAGNPEIVLPTEVFSPRFVEFFQTP